MEMQHNDKFCGMAEKFSYSLTPIVEHFNKLEQLVDAQEDTAKINRIATILLIKFDELYLSCALEFLEEEDMKEAYEEWKSLDANDKLDMIRNFSR